MIQSETVQLGQLTCRTVDALPENQQPEVVVVLCHGFGAPGTDLVPLSSELLGAIPDLNEKVQFVFPEAPLSLAPYGYGDGRAWWMIDMMALQRAMEEGDFRDFRGGEPEGMAESRALLQETLEAIRERTGLGWDKIVLGGFSQGAMLTTDITLRLNENPAGLVIYSGTLLNEAEWTRLAPQRAGLNVIQSHGLQDPILPYNGAELLRDMLTNAGVEVEFIPFPSVHTITAEGLQSLVGMLRTLCSDT
ncbi:Carboxylesterase 2 [Polystyrenella longa]|uniref:Carboxylesterase 2 n=1 Tax=Polystyrenella longa TaxID=2528007 RepID=A0A518CPD6_9PLAN|nr:dienelactone hydrolase family protein [Polystyrenella longa]QDU81073.1 Carboxylesterase 2 [Polystyrenella longa]